jgi:hypothetical protein
VIRTPGSMRIRRRNFTQTGGITLFGVFSDAFSGHKMQVLLLTCTGILVIWVITIRAQRYLTLVIKWVAVCPTWQDTVRPRKKKECQQKTSKLVRKSYRLDISLKFF